MNINLAVKSRFFKKCSAILIAAWLFALYAHSSHSEIISQADTFIECHLCHGTLDKLDDIDACVAIVVQSGWLPRLTSFEALVVSNEYIRPLLRAPPLQIIDLPGF
ncbi:hypothetical protein [Colwellia sp. MEBiC06753]